MVKKLTPKDVDENLKHETEFTIKSKESLAENKKTRWKTAKRMNHINLLLTSHKD